MGEYHNMESSRSEEVLKRKKVGFLVHLVNAATTSWVYANSILTRAFNGKKDKVSFNFFSLLP